MKRRRGAFVWVVRVVICIDRKQLSSIAFKKRSDRAIELQIASKNFTILSENFNSFPGIRTYQWVTGKCDGKNNDSAVDRPRLSPPACSSSFCSSSFCLRFGFLRSVQVNGRGRPNAIFVRPHGRGAFHPATKYILARFRHVVKKMQQNIFSEGRRCPHRVGGQGSPCPPLSVVNNSERQDWLIRTLRLIAGFGWT